MYDTFIPQVYELIQPKSRVLDVGCATGRLGEKLADEKQCYVVGIEKDVAMGALAQSRCSEFFSFDVESNDTFPFKGQFDAIVLASVLEHLREPEKLLKRLHPYLKDNGWLIVIVPNAAFIQMRVMLLVGRFDYNPQGGLMDSTHLRFFTRRTIKALLESCGYHVARIQSQNLVRQRFAFLILLGRLWKSLFSIEFLLIAHKPSV